MKQPILGGHLSVEKVREVIEQAICAHVVLWSKEEIPDKIFDILIKKVNPNHIPDRELLSNRRVVNSIDWNSLTPLKAIRLMMRDKTVVDRIDLKRYDFKLSELMPVLMYHPDLVDRFDIDFDKLSATEAAYMLEINSDFIENIDLGKYKYSSSDIARLLKKFGSDDRIVRKLNLSSLDHFSIRNLLIKSGDKYIELIDLSKLKATDWLDILQKRPELLQYCNLSLFEKGDRYLLIKLVQKFPQLDYMISENRKFISSIGWEELMVYNPEKYSPMCDFSLLSRKNWMNIIKKRPELASLKKKYMID